ncbi:Bacterial type II secretion system protein F domain protein [Arthrobacter saudimassiliensis]|uniref:Bacterial type II secretion system protein F domain protein n=1 Tax=Arthrobacter saudimassiliensis TaxID=1461584 RepID=A0A078MQW3_9MICC|nr:Bacterial type II secretion system protein F domain protein [Arthrobacter saudimassiliensis]
MSAAAGLGLGLGLFLLWWSCWAAPAAGRERRPGRLAAMIAQSGIERLTAGGLIWACCAAAVLMFLVFLAITASLPVAACFALFGAALPPALVNWQASRRRSQREQLWPEAVDHLRSAIRAGLPLPEALGQLGSTGPEDLRGPFREFAADYRSGGQFFPALDNLKERLSDPVADRIIEALKVTRDVGGSDLGRLLGTLSTFLRDNARTRSELLARQSWTINAARLAVAAPWIVLVLLSSQPAAAASYNTPAGAGVLVFGLVVSLVCYRLMLRIGALPQDERVLR